MLFKIQFYITIQRISLADKVSAKNIFLFLGNNKNANELMSKAMKYEV